MTTRAGSVAAAALAASAMALAGCASSPEVSPVRLETVSEPAREVTIPGAAAPLPAEPTPTPTDRLSAAQLQRIDQLSAAGYWDVHDGITWQYRITTSTGFQVDATRTSRVVAVGDDAVDVSVTQEYRFVDGRFDPVTIVSDGRADAEGGYRESLQLSFNQAWRQAPDPVFDAEFTIPSASQLQGAQPEQISIGPLGTRAFEEYERSTRTIRNSGAGELRVLGRTREVVCFTEVRAGEVEGPDGSITPFERRADLCFVRGLGLVSSRVVAGDAWEEWTLVASTSASA